jgi:N-acetylmuramoyl-L-alanine amidase
MSESTRRSCQPSRADAAYDGASAMATHTVKEGDSLVTIAFEHRVSERSLLDANESLKKKRGDRLEVLKAGDVLVLPPPPELKTVECATGASHAFTCATWTRKLRVRLLRDARPLRNAAYSLEAGTLNGSEEFVPGDSPKPRLETSDGEGWVEAPVPALATCVRLEVPAERLCYVLQLDTIHPLDELSGVVRRLQLLGYYRGRNLDPRDDLDAEATEALRCFQRSHALPVTGKADEGTKTRLKALAGI